MPGAVPVTSAQALNNATLQHGLALAERGLRAIAEDRHLRNGLNIHKGRIVNAAVAEALGYEAVAAESILNVA
jgi:alanine dehydrogenase